MITFITIFGVALLAILFFIYVRIHNIRTGKVEEPKESFHRARKAYTKVVATKQKTAWYGKNIFKISILLILKVFVFANFLMKQLINEAKDYLSEKITPKKIEGSDNPSAFLGAMSDYKKELTKFKKDLNNKK